MLCEVIFHFVKVFKYLSGFVAFFYFSTITKAFLASFKEYYKYIIHSRDFIAFLQENIPFSVYAHLYFPR